MEVSIKESTMVVPAGETPKGSIWISNLDLVISRCHIPTIYFYKPKPNDAATATAAARLKEGLRQILVPFYPAAGRLGYDENGRLEIVCNGEGAMFVEAETTSTLDSFIAHGFTHNSLQLSQLVPKVDYSKGISSYPLIVLQVTTFKCGGVSVGTGIQHTLADGSSGLHFINTWAEITRGMSPSIHPFFDRTLLGARLQPTPSFHHVEYDPPPPLISLTTTPTPTPASEYSQSAVSVFKLTADQLNTLKSKANIASSKSIKYYSTYTILTAHLWRCITKARGLPDDQATKLYIPVDGRSRLQPPLPPGFFGNTIFLAAPIATAGGLLSEPFTDTVIKVDEQLKQLNDEYLRSSIDYLEKEGDLSSLVRGSHTFKTPNLVINSWVRLPVYGADFGWGRPIYMGPANVLQEGIIYILPSPSQGDDGSLSVVTRLETSHIKLLFQKFLYDF